MICSGAESKRWWVVFRSRTLLKDYLFELLCVLITVILLIPMATVSALQLPVPAPRTATFDMHECICPLCLSWHHG